MLQNEAKARRIPVRLISATVDGMVIVALPDLVNAKSRGQILRDIERARKHTIDESIIVYLHDGRHGDRHDHRDRLGHRESMTQNETD